MNDVASILNFRTFAAANSFFFVDGDGPSFVLEIRNIGSLISYFALSHVKWKTFNKISIYRWMKLDTMRNVSDSFYNLHNMGMSLTKSFD